jgi:outer membrane immunogenic protein
MKKILLGVVALAFSAFTSAMAADMPVAYKASLAAPVFTWTGCYLGGNGGGGRAHNDWQPLGGIALASGCFPWMVGGELLKLHRLLATNGPPNL